MVWKVPLEGGHSSPVVAGGRVFVTAASGDRLLTRALELANGQVVWEREAPHGGLEEIHRIGSHAQSTPATDGDLVVSFFGSAGLFCYDLEGNLLWSRAMGPFNNGFGAASSPILSNRLVLLCQDHDTDSFLMALHKRTGEIVWRTDRSEFPRNFSTPVISMASGPMP